MLDRRCISLTQVELPIGTRVKVIAILNQTLATIADLKAQIKSACWNVTGINSMGLQEIFTQMADQLEEYMDIFAGRITHLGGLASVTVRVAAELSMLPEYPYGIIGERENIAAVTQRLNLCTHLLQQKALQISQWEDWETSELYVEVAQILKQRLWLLQAHLQVAFSKGAESRESGTHA